MHVCPTLSFINECEKVYLKGRIFTISVEKLDKTTQIGIIPSKSGWLDSLHLYHMLDCAHVNRMQNGYDHY